MTDAATTQTSQAQQAASLLWSWLDHGWLKSCVSMWEQTLRHPEPDHDTWFTRMDKSGGTDKAEAELADVLAKHEAVAAGVKAVAEGMLALARVDPTLRYAPRIEVVEDVRTLTFPRPLHPGPDARTIVVTNPQLPDCACPMPTAKAVLFDGRAGTLGLKVVTLTVEPHLPMQTELCLVLPHQDRVMDKSAFAVAEFDLQGCTFAHTREPHLTPWGPLLASLGLRDKADAWQVSQTSTNECDAVFGAGGTARLQDNLAALGSYYTHLAELLSSQPGHTH
jgi:hypothetical protein